MVEIKGFIDTSFVEWYGKITSIVFTPHCNLRCNFCYNFGLVFEPEKYENLDAEVILMWLHENNDFVDALCITGGEPLLQSNIESFARKIKDIGLLVKLDTNGMLPEKLEAMIKKNLVDYVAMDIKAPLTPEAYSKITEVNFNESTLKKIKKSIEIIISSGIEHEFRTTVIPGFHGKEEIAEIAKSIKGANRYFLQKFMPETRYEHLNSLKPQSDEEMEALANVARRYIKEVKWRGK